MHAVLIFFNTYKGPKVTLCIFNKLKKITLKDNNAERNTIFNEKKIDFEKYARKLELERK